jgi:hypothetical protein
MDLFVLLNIRTGYVWMVNPRLDEHGADGMHDYDCILALACCNVDQGLARVPEREIVPISHVVAVPPNASVIFFTEDLS